MKSRGFTKVMFVLIVLFLYQGFTYAAIPAVERQAIIAIYNSTNGDAWANNTNWKGNSNEADGFSQIGSEDTWYGITVADDHVASISLQGNRLSGTLPAELGNLSELTYLSMYSNELTGSIPAELGNLEWLRYIYLQKNQLSGCIPASLGNIRKLKILYLFKNNLTCSIPANLGNLEYLEILSIYHNQLIGSIPPELGNLPGIKEIHLQTNQLTGTIPPQLGDLSTLVVLNASGNELTGPIPAELGDLGLLKVLNLDSNKLTGSIPAELGNLTLMETLSLYANQLDGAIPAELGNPTLLKYLYLFSNHLTGTIPAELGNLTNLRYLYLYKNHLSGNIPATFGNLTKLEILDLRSNKLTGDMSGVLVNMTKLVKHLLDFNGLFTTDTALEAFLTGLDADWADTQTIAPSNVSAVTTSHTSIEVSWTPITYTAGSGGYNVYMATAQSGPWTFKGRTADKTVSFLDVPGLNWGTTYYFKVNTQTESHRYNSNIVISDFSAVVSATTTSPLTIPSVTTTAITGITATTATGGGNVTANGGAAVTARGLCWAASSNPTIAGNHTVNGSGTGAFTGSMTGLEPGTAYHVRAYATNSAGTSYGINVIFVADAVTPTVTTTAVTSATSTSAISGGNVTDDGGTSITARGICWGTSSNPTIAGTHTVNGSGTGSFTGSMTGLEPGTAYYVRAYATSSAGTSYGSQAAFSTTTVSAAVTTAAITGITSTTGTGGGNVTSDGGAAVTARGVCWSTSTNPTTADSHTVDGNGTGSFTSALTDLEPGTAYFVRAYATNSTGTAYGSQVSFTTTTVLPTVVTTDTTALTSTTASGGGNVTANGGIGIFARGICWSIAANPTTAADHTSNGTGTGSFSSSITGLTAGATYYVRAYATNAVGTAYGSQMSFTTPVTTTISGIVTDGANPVEGVNIIFTHNEHVEVTDANGAYSYEVPQSATTRLVPQKAGYHSWNPVDAAYTNITSDQVQNFVGTADNYTVSGTAADGSTPLAGVEILFSHDGHIATTDADGNYSYTVPHGTTFTTTASKTGYDFTPAEFSYETLNQDKTWQNFYGSHMVAVSIVDPAEGEVVEDAVIVKAEATASNADLEVTHVDFYIDGALVKQDLDSPYQYRWETGETADGNHTIKTIAYFTTGLTAEAQVTAYVANGMEPAHIELNRTRLNYGFILEEQGTSAQTLLITNTGGGTLNWSAEVSDSWIQASALSGTGNSEISVSIDPTGLVIGDYQGTIVISAPETDNAPVTVDVYLVVKELSGDLPLIGSIDTPEDSAIVAGGIAVTGWALDDSEVMDVQIFRNPVPGENGPVHLGSAVFVDGARPDIEAQYPDYPKNYVAGWGYMVLTQTFPNDGNGTFTIMAVGTDNSGRSVTLGTRTIVCDNGNAVMPFGTIDTPEQGGEASGENYANFGWTLTPRPNTIPMDGSTIKVVVDGVPLEGHVEYNIYREDIANAFPGYNNTGGAMGYYYLDTTVYANGLHTIAWIVTDDAGNSAGIGSRYFKIVNAENDTAAPTYSSSGGMSTQSLGISSSPVLVAKGLGGYVQTLLPNDDGIINVDIKGNERVEVNLRGQDFAAAGSTFTTRFDAHLSQNDTKRMLPVGSTLDAKRGIFYWQPGPGYVGDYLFVFTEKTRDGAISKKVVKVTIASK